MKVYRMNDYDWVAATSEEEAIQFICELVELPEDEATDEPRVLTDEEMDRLVFTDKVGAKSSFSEHLQEILREGTNEPFFFAGTEY